MIRGQYSGVYVHVGVGVLSAFPAEGKTYHHHIGVVKLNILYYIYIPITTNKSCDVGMKDNKVKIHVSYYEI